MNLEFFTPVSEDLLKEFSGQAKCLANKMTIHTRGNLPNMEGVKLAVFGVLEDRLDLNGDQQPFDFSGIRRQFYQLFPGNWDIKIADLGDIRRGETVKDTYYAVRETVTSLLKADVIPVMLGGGQDVLYPTYRAYTQLDRPVNLVNVDWGFDLGNIKSPMDNRSYMGRIIVKEPFKLFNYSVIGYQTYFNPQAEIELMDRLFFDAYRLGEMSPDLGMAEPIMRDADIVGIDLGAISATALGNVDLPSPNGFDSREFCVLARYAGISDRVSCFGIFEYTGAHNNPVCNMLIAQALWYFAEGVNYRRDEDVQTAKDDFIKYQVPVEDETLVFYKSPVTGRWWIEISVEYGLDNNLTRNTLLPCTEREYLDACNQKMPERWYKTKYRHQL